MDEFLQQVVDNMRKNEFEVVELHTAQEACDYLNEHIAAGKTVGVGGSVSVRATGILEKLQEKAPQILQDYRERLTQRVE